MGFRVANTRLTAQVIADFSHGRVGGRSTMRVVCGWTGWNVMNKDQEF